MSLTSLIKSLHNAGGKPTLLPTIERFFMRKSHEYDEEKQADRVTRFHPSQISYWGVCPRAYYLLMKREELGFGLPRKEPFQTSLLRIFEHGHSIHEMYQNKILGPAGVLYGKWECNGDVIWGFQPSESWDYVEPRIWWGEKRISGYCDGFLFIDGKWTVLEIKSTNDQSFRWIKRSGEAKPYHARQAQLYLEAPNDAPDPMELEGAIILYINKDTGEEFEVFIEKDPESIRPIIEGIDVAIDSLDGDQPPPQVDDCKSSRSKRAKDCLACNICFGVNDGG